MARLERIVTVFADSAAQPHPPASQAEEGRQRPS
jgi:hypothetical protein